MIITDVQVYERALFKRYHAPVCSTANLLRLASHATVLILTFYIVYSSGNLWKKMESYREQPIVAFRRELVLHLDVKDANNAVKHLQWSSFPELNQLLDSNTLLSPLVSTSSVDVDRDSRLDEIKVLLRVPIENGFSVHRVQLALFLNLQLKDHIGLEMNSALVLHHESFLGGVALLSSGDLRLKQRHPLPNVAKRIAYLTPPLDRNSIRQADDISFRSWLPAYNARNESTMLDAPNPIWIAGHDPVFTINTTIRIPTQTISYIPGFAETMKFAWIQYLSIAVILYFFVFDVFALFVFSEQVVQTEVRADGTSYLKAHHF